jgi:hypothetical protein
LMPGKHYTPARFVLLFFCIAFLLLLRKPDLLTNPQLYAEDASVFFRDQLVFPRIAVFLPYNGQFHLVPRLIALFESIFPLGAVPLVCSMASILVHALCLSVFFLPWNRWLIADDLMRAAACLVLATALDGMEMIGFSGPLMWYLFLAGILLLFRPENGEPLNRARRWSAPAALAVIGMSAAPMMTLAPVAVWRAIKRQGLQRTMALALLAALAVQAFALVFSQRSDHPAQPVAGLVLMGWQIVAATIVSWTFAGVVTPLAGRDAAMELGKIQSIGPPLLVVIGLVALLTWLLTVSPPYEGMRLALALYLALGTLASAIYTRNLIGISPSLNSNAYAMPARYMVLANVLLVYMICLVLRRLPFGDTRLQVACLVLVFAAGIHGNFRQQPYPDFAWNTAASKIVAWRAARAAGKPHPLAIPIAPAPWIIDLP